MELDVPSQAEFDRLQTQFNLLMSYMGLEFYPCNHDKVTDKEEWRRKHYCNECLASGEKIRKVP